MKLFHRKLELGEWIIVTQTVVIIVLVIALLMTCNKNKKQVDLVKENAAIKNEKQITQPITKDSLDRKKIVDSIRATYKSVGKEVEKLVSENKLLKENISEQSAIISDLLNERSASTDYDEPVLAKYNNLLQIYERQNSNWSTIVGLKDFQISLKDVEAAQKDSLYQNVRKGLDSCLQSNNAAIAEKDKNKERSKLGIGFIGNFFPSAGIGGGFVYVHKSGWIFHSDVMRMNDQWHYMGGLKKVISIRKK